MSRGILQPSFIPSRGNFHQIQRADIFVFYDCVQYDKHGWRNRKRIKIAQGPPMSHDPGISLEYLAYDYPGPSTI
jgi:hypothetical protein